MVTSLFWSLKDKYIYTHTQFRAIMLKIYHVSLVLFCFQITKNMRNSLSSLGYTEADIDKMTPGEASDAINHCIRKSTKAIQGSEIQKDKFTGIP